MKKLKLEEDIVSKTQLLDIISKSNASNEQVSGVPDGTGCWPDSVLDWPLESFAESLCHDLFSQKWEIRHGAATALREVIRLHGKGIK